MAVPWPGHGPGMYTKTSGGLRAGIGNSSEAPDVRPPPARYFSDARPIKRRTRLPSFPAMSRSGPPPYKLEDCLIVHYVWSVRCSVPVKAMLNFRKYGINDLAHANWFLFGLAISFFRKNVGEIPYLHHPSRGRA